MRLAFSLEPNTSVHTIYLTHRLTLQLRIATRHHDKGSLVFSHHAMYSLPTFMICSFGDGTCIDETYIGLFALGKLGTTPISDNILANVEVSEKLSLQPSV